MPETDMKNVSCRVVIGGLVCGPSQHQLITTYEEHLELLDEIGLEYRSDDKRAKQLLVQYLNTKNPDLKQVIASDLFKEFGEVVEP